jgi:hypothetical protein
MISNLFRRAALALATTAAVLSLVLAPASASSRHLSLRLTAE